MTDKATTPPPGFEGPEKKLEIDLKRKVGAAGGLLLVPSELWQKMLDLARCTIIGEKSSDSFKMFILSESSLFVYRHKMVIKTCGTTTLLRIIPFFLSLVSKDRNEVNESLAETLAMEVEYVSYSRKNFIFPEKQEKPHRSFSEELQYLEPFFEGGKGYVLGPMNGEHWNFFVADYTAKEDEATNPADQTLEVLMSRLPRSTMKHFFKEAESDVDKATLESGIADILPGSVIDATLFDPCGYSMNGMTADEAYWTIHITPEEHCSYVSFETNAAMDNYTELIARGWSRCSSPSTVW
eukprot:Sspe_Gene.64276::Locus_37789_Transcript_1_1_Confidence_1.000_Length_1132::g.64276::m.64276/K01611/speD, AMD1; S-adenosylmethionine decarboxylase